MDDMIWHGAKTEKWLFSHPVAGRCSSGKVVILLISIPLHVIINFYFHSPGGYFFRRISGREMSYFLYDLSELYIIGPYVRVRIFGFLQNCTGQVKL